MKRLAQAWVVLWAAAVCLAGSGNVELKGRVEARPGGGLIFKTASGESYALKRTEMAEALFEDERLRAKTLLLKGKVTEEGGFEVAGNIHSIKNGKIHELYYYCSVCAITTSFPGPCLCCRQPVELVEKPVR